MDKTIRTLSNKYVAQCLGIFLLLYGVSLFCANQMGYEELLAAPLLFSTIFNIVIGCIVALMWRWVAENQKDMLTTFYSATNGFRMLIALAALLILYAVVGRDSIKPYVWVFAVFYLIAIAHHAVYFARITNNQSI